MNFISLVTVLGKAVLVVMGVIVALTGVILLVNLAVPSLLGGLTH
ncbi:hypothetical protein CLV85_0556 [Salinibacterium amurskyense]|uniref:Uncharacterized protein n=1 Tax=Salinibacterium amurskyense TaxID=205941 RepID=A0A2M9D7B6_9MICO|nr:hypothetical protein [Salinibacterium amurskyense]PJJ81383.1 hypothetical protein CLV85_0556 [Salinibacterium amurskyense]GHD80684.1 hypothetical protein GCM10007394_12530 [Salinibacterium amurskyense]